MILIDLSQVIISNLMTQVGKNTDDIDDEIYTYDSEFYRKHKEKVFGRVW